jgi:DNA polymerase-1
MSDKTLLLVDGTAMAYRAFYAIANLSTKAGQPSNAVFGFIKLLRQLEQTWAPTHWVVAFDGGLPEARVALLGSYKAQRKEMPDDLRGQLDLINEYVERARVPAVRLEGEEADDVMATYATWGREAGARVLLATSDKDMFQLVGDRVSIVSLTKAGEKMGPAEVQAKTGVSPERVVEWQALIGDSSDNIPGVPGVGPKTAAKLLGQFGDVETLWAGLDQVTPDKLRDSLRGARDVVARNLRMMKLREDLPCAKDWDALRVRRPDYDRLAPFLEKMEFDSMLNDLRDQASRLF